MNGALSTRCSGIDDVSGCRVATANSVLSVVDAAFGIAQYSTWHGVCTVAYSRRPLYNRLEERRNRADLIEVFKMAHGFSAIPLTDMFQIDASGRTTIRYEMLF